VPPPRRPLATVYVAAASDDDADAFIVAETPDEALELIAAARRDLAAGTGHGFATLTLANPEHGSGTSWNGRPVHVDAWRVVSIAPPLDAARDD
jgi:hypothetical protein